MAGKNLTYEHSVQQERKTHLKNLKSTTSFIVETGQNAPPKKIASIMANPRKKMKEQERYQAIEAENARLLSRMTKIMDAAPRLSVLHRTKVFISNAPTRRNEALHVAKLNQVVLERLNKTGPFYDHKQWAKDRKATEHILGGMGLYPYVPPPAKKADDFFEKDPLKLKSYESKLDEQWAESLSAFASRSSVLDEELEGQGHGRRAVSLTPSSLKRPGNDDWMLPGLGRPGIYSQAKQGKTMQVIPDGRLPYQFSARTPSPKPRHFADSTIRTDSIPKNVLIAKPAAPVIELDDQISFEESPDRLGFKMREGRPANGSRPASAARPGSASAIRPGSAGAARPISAQRPTSATKTLTSRPSSANVAVTTLIIENHEPIFKSDLNSENRTEGQASGIFFESSHNSATNPEIITANPLEHQAIQINSNSAEAGDEAIALNSSADTPTPALDSISAIVEEPEKLKDNSDNESVASVMRAIVAECTDTASVPTIDDNSSSVNAEQSNTIGVQEIQQPSGGELACDAAAERSSPVTDTLGDSNA